LDAVRKNLTAYYRQVADIDLEGYDWIPIGTQTAPFTGTYSGNKFKIKHLKVSIDGNAGLFGYKSGGLLSNIILENVDISGLNSGGIVGFLYQGTISACACLSGIIRGNAAGGIAGAVNINTIAANITNSYNDTNIKGDSYAGGIAGYFTQTGSISAYPSCNVSLCYSKNIVESGVYCGGIVGYSTVADSYARINISKCYCLCEKIIRSSGLSTNFHRILGYKGNTYTTITKCYSRDDTILQFD